MMFICEIHLELTTGWLCFLCSCIYIAYLWEGHVPRIQKLFLQDWRLKKGTMLCLEWLLNATASKSPCRRRRICVPSNCCDSGPSIDLNCIGLSRTKMSSWNLLFASTLSLFFSTIMDSFNIPHRLAIQHSLLTQIKHWWTCYLAYLLTHLWRYCSELITGWRWKE